MPDTTTQVKAILARTLHDLEQTIENPGVKSLLRSLHGILGVEDDGTAATRRRSRARPKPPAASGASAAQITSVSEQKREGTSKRTRSSAKPTAASTAHASSAAHAGRNGRREQLLALVVDQPGITVAQAAKQFGLKDGTGLYPVARRLQDEGLVRKHGAELHPTAKAQRKR